MAAYLRKVEKRRQPHVFAIHAENLGHRVTERAALWYSEYHEEIYACEVEMSLEAVVSAYCHNHNEGDGDDAFTLVGSPNAMSTPIS